MVKSEYSTRKLAPQHRIFPFLLGSFSSAQDFYGVFFSQGTGMAMAKKLKTLYYSCSLLSTKFLLKISWNIMKAMLPRRLTKDPGPLEYTQLHMNPACGDFFFLYILLFKPNPHWICCQNVTQLLIFVIKWKEMLSAGMLFKSFAGKDVVSNRIFGNLVSTDQ